MAIVAGAINKPKGYGQVTATGSAFDLTVAPAQGVALPDNCIRALIQAEAQALRWRDDGSNPTATVGMIIPANGILEYEGDLSKIKLIAATGGAIANITYYAN